ALLANQPATPAAWPTSAHPPARSEPQTRSQRWCLLGSVALTAAPEILRAMASLHNAQLAAITSAVEDNSQRIVDLAGELDESRSSDAIADLYEAERSLRM